MLSSKSIFQESSIFYEQCIKSSGYKTKLQHQPPKESNQNKKERECNIIWFNSPHSRSVKINIRRILIKLISNHFPPNHKLIKIFNKNTIKLSYSCMTTIRSKKKGHNKQILQPSSQNHKNHARASIKKISN